MWIARDRDNKLYLYPEKPIRNSTLGIFSADDFSEIKQGYCPEVTWENSPKEVVLQ